MKTRSFDDAEDAQDPRFFLRGFSSRPLPENSPAPSKASRVAPSKRKPVSPAPKASMLLADGEASSKRVKPVLQGKRAAEEDDKLALSPRPSLAPPGSEDKFNC